MFKEVTYDTFHLKLLAFPTVVAFPTVEFFSKEYSN